MNPGLRCAILQPSYIPWRGYFHQIQKVDLFVFCDDVQYDSRGWRNRNIVKTANGPIWLTIPVGHKNNIASGQRICDTEIQWSRKWNVKHWLTIERSYKRAPYFRRYADLLRPFYESHPTSLADFTIDLTVTLARQMGLKTRFLRSSALNATGDRVGRLIHILQNLGATSYLTGPSARDYLDLGRMHDAGIDVEFMSYQYPEYPQLHGAFVPHVSVLDLLFTVGPELGRFVWDVDDNSFGDPGRTPSYGVESSGSSATG